MSLFDRIIKKPVSDRRLEMADFGPDAPGCELFMDFPSPPGGYRVCPECGTWNKEGTAGCVVCGRKK